MIQISSTDFIKLRRLRQMRKRMSLWGFKFSQRQSGGQFGLHDVRSLREPMPRKGFKPAAKHSGR